MPLRLVKTRHQKHPQSCRGFKSSVLEHAAQYWAQIEFADTFPCSVYCTCNTSCVLIAGLYCDNKQCDLLVRSKEFQGFLAGATLKDLVVCAVSGAHVQIPRWRQLHSPFEFAWRLLSPSTGRLPIQPRTPRKQARMLSKLTVQALSWALP